MHISLDGFVAGPKGEMNWIHVDEEIFDYVGIRIQEGDTSMYGRKTYQMMENYWPTAADKPNPSKHELSHSKWYKKVNKIVLSESMKDTGPENTTVISGDLSERVREIKQKPGPEILIFGSPSATHSLIQLGLIDGYWLFLNPVILGQGIPLFQNVQEKTKLSLTGTHRFSSGVIELNYQLVQ